MSDNCSLWPRAKCPLSQLPITYDVARVLGKSLSIRG
jgi:hypothetical protein